MMPSTLYSWIMNNQGLEREGRGTAFPLQLAYCFQFGDLSASHTSQKKLISMLLPLGCHSVPYQIHQSRYQPLICFPFLTTPVFHVLIKSLISLYILYRASILCKTQLMTLIPAYDSGTNTVTTGYRTPGPCLGETMRRWRDSPGYRVQCRILSGPSHCLRVYFQVLEAQYSNKGLEVKLNS